MQQLVYDVLLGVLILAFLSLLLIPAFRDNAELISSTAQRVGEGEKIKADSLAGLEKFDATGSDVISAIRYYRNDPLIRVIVRKLDGSVLEFCGPAGSLAAIGYEEKYAAGHVYEGKSLKEAVFIQKP